MKVSLCLERQGIPLFRQSLMLSPTRPSKYPWYRHAVVTNFRGFPGSSRTSFRGRCSKSPFRYPLMSLSCPSHVPLTSLPRLPLSFLSSLPRPSRVSPTSHTRLSRPLHVPRPCAMRPCVPQLVTASQCVPLASLSRQLAIVDTSLGRIGDSEE